MSGEPLPGEVLAFLVEHVTSLDALAVLAAMIDGGPRWWDAKAIALQVGLPPAEARRVLEGFARSNLLDLRVTGDVRYQLHPGSEEQESGLHAFAAQYRRAPAVISRWVAERARGRAAADFADAFRITKR